jgi:cytochrome oxidase Cu insertion factor (SCO1/SenC/PrrC family)
VLVAVSVDPLDTASSARAAATKWGLAAVAPWHWLMGTRAQLAPIWREYHIFVGPRVHGDIAHTEALILVDRRGYERSGYLWPFEPRSVAHDLRMLGKA